MVTMTVIMIIMKIARVVWVGGGGGDYDDDGDDNGGSGGGGNSNEAHRNGGNDCLGERGGVNFDSHIVIVKTMDKSTRASGGWMTCV